MAAWDAILWPIIGAVVFSTMALIVGTLVWSILTLPKLPPEVLQLRVFESGRGIYFALLALTIGTLANILAVAPLFLGLNPPLAWYAATTAVWAVVVWSGFLLLIRTFRSSSSFEGALASRKVA